MDPDPGDPKTCGSRSGTLDQNSKGLSPPHHILWSFIDRDLGTGGSRAIVHKCRVEFRRERTGLKYAVPGQRKIRRDKRKPEKFTGAQGQYTHIFLL
jgi:hypothetical protein